jgi:O-antigen ligase
VVAALRKLKEQPQWHWYAMLAIIFFEYVRPQDFLLTFMKPLRLPGILTLVAAFIFIANDKGYLKRENVFKLMILFMTVAAVTIVFAPNTRAVYNKTILLFWTYVSFVFPLYAVVTNYERLRTLMFFWIGLQGILGFQVMINGGHGPGSYLWDENDVAMTLCMAIPYAAYFAFLPGMPKKYRFLLLMVALVLIGGIGVSASRGGVVGLAATIMASLAISKRPFRNFAIMALVMALATPIVLSNLSDAYKQDMGNISNPEDSTRDERLWSWSIGWVMYLENPVWGVGAGNYDWTNHLYAHKSPMYTPKRKILGGRAAHSLYFTLLPELGTVGVVVWLSILIWAIKRFFKYRRFFNRQEAPTDEMIFYMAMMRAMAGSTIAFLSAGAFITVLYYPPYWHLIGLFAITCKIASDRLPEFAEELGGGPVRGGRKRKAR